MTAYANGMRRIAFVVEKGGRRYEVSTAAGSALAQPRFEVADVTGGAVPVLVGAVCRAKPLADYAPRTLVPELWRWLDVGKGTGRRSHAAWVTPLEALDALLTRWDRP